MKQQLLKQKGLLKSKEAKTYSNRFISANKPLFKKHTFDMIMNTQFSRHFFSISFFLMFCSSIGVYGQHTIQGTVREETSNIFLQSVSVFLSNTKVGMATGADGHYSIVAPAGDYDMIISSIGYETNLVRLSHLSSDTVINVSLHPKTAELAEVVVKSYEKDGWKKWGDLFLRVFMGTSYEASRCVIENREVIYFKHNKSTDVITAFADEPLQITNKALGYHLQYQLEHFSYNPRTSQSFYEGYPLFRDMEGDAKQQKQWTKNRADVYKGSEMQFMRALYNDKLKEEGFDVTSIWKPSAEEIRGIRDRISRNEISKDSLNFYLQILSDISGNGIASDAAGTITHIVYRTDSTTAALRFTNFINVLYFKGISSQDYNS